MRPLDQNVRFCRHCQTKKPLHMFVKDGDGHLTHQCYQCKINYAKERQGLRANDIGAAEFREFVGKFTSSSSSDLTHVMSIMKELMKKHGGVESFCLNWHKQWKAAEDKNPGGRTVLDQYMGVTKLHATLNEQQQNARRDIDDMSDEEIDAELMQMAMEKMLKIHDEPPGDEAEAV